MSIQNIRIKKLLFQRNVFKCSWKILQNIILTKTLLLQKITSTHQFYVQIVKLWKRCYEIWKLFILTIFTKYNNQEKTFSRNYQHRSRFQLASGSTIILAQIVCTQTNPVIIGAVFEWAKLPSKRLEALHYWSNSLG